MFTQVNSQKYLPQLLKKRKIQSWVINGPQKYKDTGNYNGRNFCDQA